MKVKLKKKLPTKPAVLRSVARSYINGLTTLALFQMRSGNIPTMEQLTKLVATFEGLCEAAKNGDRVQIRLRKIAQGELSDALVRVITFLESVAQEEDIPALLQASFELSRLTIRKKAGSKPVPAEQAEVIVATGGT